MVSIGHLPHPRGRLRPLVVSLVGATLSLVCGVLACGGPFGPLPGGALSGPVKAGDRPDPELVASAESIELETRPDDPYSVRVWCGEVGGRLYVPTSLVLGPDEPEARAWVRHVLADPRVRLRIGGIVYPMRAVRVDDSEELERARAALLAKYDVERDAHAEAAWLFRMEPR